MYVKPVYLRRRRTKRAQMERDAPVLTMREVSSETPRPVGFSPTAVLTHHPVIAR